MRRIDRAGTVHLREAPRFSVDKTQESARHSLVEVAVPAPYAVVRPFVAPGKALGHFARLDLDQDREIRNQPAGSEPRSRGTT